MTVDPLAELRSALTHFRDPPAMDRGWSDPSAVGRVFRKIEETFGLLSSEAINRDSIADAVLRYQSTGKIASLQDLKYTCFGATTPIRPSNYLVIEDSTRFGGLLARVSDLGREPRMFRRCYQGLLLGYLEYPGLWTEHDKGRKNWRALRRFLEVGLDRLLAATACWHGGAAATG